MARIPTLLFFGMSALATGTAAFAPTAQAEDSTPDRLPQPHAPGTDPDPGPALTPVDQKSAGGDAESAPVPPASRTAGPSTISTEEAWRHGPRHRIAVMPHYVYRVSGAGQVVTPTSGFGIGGTVEWAYLRLGPRLEGALGIDFSHDRFSSSEEGTVNVDNVTETFRNPRVTSETSFVVVHTVAAHWGRVRPFVALGVGLGIGYFDSAAAALRPGTARDAHALGRAAAGVDIAIGRDLSLSFRAEYTAVRGVSTTITDGGERLALFGDLMDIGAGIAYRF